MSLFLIIIYSFFLIIDPSLSCGISTHIEIAHRAAVHYDHIFDQNLSAKKVCIFFLNKYKYNKIILYFKAYREISISFSG